MDLQDTIVAIASPPGGAARGIVRLSGDAVLQVVQQCFASPRALDWSALTRPQRIPGELQLHDAATQRSLSLPGAMFVWPTSQSYTRQPSAEFHTWGSPPLLQSAVDAFCQAGARVARPGEFTLRAFLAGRIDLTQAEAVLGVIDAHDEQQLQRSLAQLAGGIAQPLGQLREQLLEALAHLEAGLDFVDEDIEFISHDELDRQLAAAEVLLQDLLSRMEQQVESTDVVRMVLLGRPNAGKSSLLNALAGEEAALVSDVAGTTRDYVTRRLQIDGHWIELVDTAGIEEVLPDEPIPAAAQRMTQAALDQAEIVLLCLDGGRARDAWEAAALARLSSENSRPHEHYADTLVVLTKSDLHLPAEQQQLPGAIHTSCLTGAGLDELRTELTCRILARQGGDVLPATALRCRDSLRRSAEALARARDAAQAHAGEELVAAELWLALDELGQVVGAVYTDDMLDRLFSRFCIGK